MMPSPEAERFSFVRRSRSERETVALGERLGRVLEDGDVVALFGELGAGKTQFIRGVCAGAGVLPGHVSSPSFAIVATYRGRLTVHHADLYRVLDADELFGTGFGDLVSPSQPEGVLLVEWADRVPGAIPQERLNVSLAHDEKDPSVRHLTIEGIGQRHGMLARSLA